MAIVGEFSPFRKKRMNENRLNINTSIEKGRGVQAFSKNERKDQAAYRLLEGGCQLLAANSTQLLLLSCFLCDSRITLSISSIP